MNNSLNSSISSDTNNCTWTTGKVSNLGWDDVSTSITSTSGLNVSGSSILVGKTTPATVSWGDTNYTTGYITVQDNLGSLITYLKEPEIENMLDILIERAVDDNNLLKQIISSVIRSRHFSEEFILKYFDYVGLPDIRCHHASDINSHNYERLALLIVASRD